jgi:ADP-ribose pyrophosphatase
MTIPCFGEAMETNKQSPLQKYVALKAASPELFLNPPGSVIRIVDDPEDQRTVEQSVGDRLEDSGWPREGAQIGVLVEDPYVKIVRDAVEFPDGRKGAYIRILAQRRGVAGVAIMPTFEGRILLVRHFRHATRDWHWEIPRGYCEEGETPDAAAIRELKEEIGAEVHQLAPLGTMHPNTGLLEERVQVFAALITTLGKVAQHDGIAEVRALSHEEVRQMILHGEITDSFTLAALHFSQSSAISLD